MSGDPLNFRTFPRGEDWPYPMYMTLLWFPTQPMSKLEQSLAGR